MNLDDLKEHGGPAFPTHRLQWDYGSEERELATKHSGMTLRDFFAAEVGVNDTDITVPYGEAIVGRKMPDYARDPMANAVFWADVRARLRYIEADAMIRARGAA